MTVVRIPCVTSPIIALLFQRIDAVTGITRTSVTYGVTRVAASTPISGIRWRSCAPWLAGFATVSSANSIERKIWIHQSKAPLVSWGNVTFLMKRGIGKNANAFERFPNAFERVWVFYIPLFARKVTLFSVVCTNAQNKYINRGHNGVVGLSASQPHQALVQPKIVDPSAPVLFLYEGVSANSRHSHSK